MKNKKTEHSIMENHKILVVDDDAGVRRLLKYKLEFSGYDVDTAINGHEAFEKIKKGNNWDLVITDLMMPKMNGDELLRSLQEYNPDIPVMMITAYGSVEHAVKSLKQGACDYITKPIQLEELFIKVSNILEKQDMKIQIRQLQEKLRQTIGTTEIIGTSKAIQETFKQITMVARSDVSVIILGESGTGKELVANAVHSASDRSNKPFIPVNCGALPQDLLENELFGHVKGAYTGAHSSQKGLFQEAVGGTIFLDEITEMSLSTQVKLLRVLQEGEIKPVGTPKSVKVDVRVLAASNKDILKEVEKGNFREDLYYRLNVVTIEVPPLRKRKEDIPLLANYFLKKYTNQFNKKIEGISQEAVEKLISYEWPGNVRELENKIQQAILMSKTKQISPDDLSIWVEPEVRPLRNFQDAKDEIIADFERNYIIRALKIYSGNISQASKKAGKDRKSFWRIMKKYDIDPDKFRD
jgi:DNA-binding NtrC family response regulator